MKRTLIAIAVGLSMLYTPARAQEFEPKTWTLVGIVTLGKTDMTIYLDVASIRQSPDRAKTRSAWNRMIRGNTTLHALTVYDCAEGTYHDLLWRGWVDGVSVNPGMPALGYQIAPPGSGAEALLRAVCAQPEGV